jgi:ferredoxin
VSSSSAPVASPSSTYAFTEACTACGACLLTCPEAAIVVGIPLQVRDDRCTSCGECLEVCPADAVVELGGRR